MAGKSKLDGADVGSGRYPLGSGDRPYQDYPSLQQRIKEKKLEYENDEAIKKLDNMKREKEINEPRRELLLKKGSAKDILKYSHEYTHEELQRAIQRFRDEQDLSRYIKGPFDKIAMVFNGLGKAIDWTDKGIKGYNNFAKVMNVINREDIEAGRKKPFTVIEQGKNKK